MASCLLNSIDNPLVTLDIPFSSDKMSEKIGFQVSFDKNSNQVVASCKADGRLYFLKCGSSDLDELELIGFTTIDDSILSITWDIPTAQGYIQQ